MERKDVTTILKRIKSNYSEFILDDYTISEWYRELKDYDIDDVMRKLEDHFRNEQYGKYPPKVYFLTKYLTKTKEKHEKENLILTCPICGRQFEEEKFDKHYGRCSSIEYIVKANKEYFDKDINKEDLYNISDEVFDKAYYMFCKRVYESGKVKGLQKQCIENVLKNCRGNW